MKSSVLKTDALLLLAAAIWGFAFVAQRVGMAHMGPFAFNAVRFALGSLVLLPFMLAPRVRRPLPSGEGRMETGSPGAADPPGGGLRVFAGGGALAGLVLFTAVSLQQTGLVYTTAGKAGFITGLYVVVVPILGLLWRQRPGAWAWAGAFCAAAGLYLLSVTGRLTISLGDSLVLAGALFWAVHVLIIAWLTFRIDPIRLAFAQFIVCSALSFLGALLFETITIEGIRGALIPILYAGGLSVGVAYTLQVVAQR
jgi:drug/metabolite transporter (DMT)-like permease